MTVQYKYSTSSNTVPATLGDQRVRTNTLEVTCNAEEGSVATSSIVIDDPLGDFDIIGHRNFGIREMSITSGQSYLWVGATAERKISRADSERTTVGREWEVSLVDINTFLERRIMVGLDNNRAAETDVARVQWLLTTAEGNFIGDTRYFSTANPVAMDAVDYRGQTFKSVLDDCAQQSGKDYWVTTFEDTATANFPWGLTSLWYDFRSSSAYQSTLSLSNDLDDITNGLGLVIPYSQEETTLTRDPSRVYSSAYVTYDGGTAYVNNIATQNAFARRDASVPAENVKTAAKAQARGTRYLADIDTEEDVIETSVQVPAASVNLIREGMAVGFTATHLPGYETPQYVRVLNRTVKQDSERTYRIRMELGSGGGPVTNVGRRIGGYLCSADGYVLPWCSGSGEGALTATIPGTNLAASSTETVKLYDGATYRCTFTADHNHTGSCDNDLGGTMGPSELGAGITSTTNPQGGTSRYIFGSEYIGDATTSAQFDITMGANGDPCQPLWVFEGAGFFSCNVIGSIVTCVVTYVSGPDPRFVGLSGCPLP